MIGTTTDISAAKQAQESLAHRAAQQAATATLSRFALDALDLGTLGLEASRIIAQVLGPDDWHVHVVWADGSAPQWERRAHDVSVGIGRWGEIRLSSNKGAALDPQRYEFVCDAANSLQAAAQQHAARTQLEHNATHDPLTGLPNRTLLLDRMDHARAVAGRTGKHFGMLFLDLDGFKFVNDALGHDTGDQLLRMAAERLCQIMPSADTVARFGGDEFVIVCPDADDEQKATAVAARIRHAFEEPFRPYGTDLSVTVSIGVVTGDAATDGRILLREADAAMHAAKESGRNRTEVFNASLHREAKQHLEITTGLRSALQGDGLEVHYQPTVELATGLIAGVEALIRWRRPDGELVLPDAFIAIAEDTGLIDALGDHVLERACHDAQRWIHSQGTGFMISVNVSPHQLGDDHLNGAVVQVLRDSGIPSRALVLEITESTLMSERAAQSTMTQLRKLGVRLAIDDFGSGYSSLSYLRHLPVDFLKIDRSFVSGLTSSLQDRTLVTAAVDLAHSFGLLAVAEGVEDEDQRAQLTTLGCEFAQGYLWSAPVPAGEVTRLLEHQVHGRHTTKGPAVEQGGRAPSGRAAPL